MKTLKAWRLRHAFFYARLFLLQILFSSLSLATQASSSLPPSCLLEPQSLQKLEQVKVAKLADGDSLTLRDGRKVRLIGLNTPEMHKKPSGIKEPLADEAKRALSHSLGGEFYLKTGSEKNDRYGRVLAHAFNKHGENIEAILLQRGLAFPVGIQPNLDFIACHEKVSAQAKRQTLGVWKHSYFKPTAVKQIGDQNTGFTRISGRVKEISYTSKDWWVQLEGNAVLKIAKKDQSLFSKNSLNTLIGSTLTVNGWMINRGESAKRRGYSEYMMLLKHPIQLEQY